MRNPGKSPGGEKSVTLSAGGNVGVFYTGAAAASIQARKGLALRLSRAAAGPVPDATGALDSGFRRRGGLGGPVLQARGNLQGNLGPEFPHFDAHARNRFRSRRLPFVQTSPQFVREVPPGSAPFRMFAAPMIQHGGGHIVRIPQAGIMGMAMAPAGMALGAPLR